MLEAAAGETPAYELPIAEARRLADAAALAVGQPEPVASVLQLAIPGPGLELPGMLYAPLETAHADGLLVYFHGGGFATGSVAGYDHRLRRLANRTGWPVLGVDYRLAPENPFPAAVEDAEYAFAWALAGHPADRPVVVIGDSAGGNLATIVARRCRDKGGQPPAGQVLLYPVTDFGPGPESFAYPSYLECAVGYGLTTAHMRWYHSLYVDGVGADFAVADLSPLRAERLDGLPPALIITAEYDVLRDEGEAYAGRLREAGVRTELLRFAGHVHGFVGEPSLADSAGALDEVARFLESLAP
jgi:acetyl esterase